MTEQLPLMRLDESTEASTVRSRVPNLPRDSQGRPYHTQKTLDEDERLMQTEDLSKVKVW